MARSDARARAARANGLKAAVRAGLWRVAPGLWRRWQKPARQEFSIGIYAGPDLLRLGPVPGVGNPVLSRHDVTDVPARLVADPFLCRVQDRWQLFFEIIDSIARKGVIGVATSDDALRWQYQGVVLSEPFHLSYPNVFDWQGSVYMIPESGQARAVRLYRAVSFPQRWELVATLLEDATYVDSSIFRFEGRWWLFTAVWQESRSLGPALHLYYAHDLQGPWWAHAENPLLGPGIGITRPAGRVVLDDAGFPVRFAQNGYPDYGTEVHAFRILELSRTRYVEEPVGERFLAAGSECWNSGGMHHIDAHRLPDQTWIAAVDGWPRRSEQ